MLRAQQRRAVHGPIAGDAGPGSLAQNIPKASFGSPFLELVMSGLNYINKMMLVRLRKSLQPAQRSFSIFDRFKSQDEAAESVKKTASNEELKIDSSHPVQRHPKPIKAKTPVAAKTVKAQPQKKQSGSVVSEMTNLEKLVDVEVN